MQHICTHTHTHGTRTYTLRRAEVFPLGIREMMNRDLVMER